MPQRAATSLKSSLSCGDTFTKAAPLGVDGTEGSVGSALKQAVDEQKKANKNKL